MQEFEYFESTARIQKKRLLPLWLSKNMNEVRLIVRITCQASLVEAIKTPPSELEKMLIPLPLQVYMGNHSIGEACCSVATSVLWVWFWWCDLLSFDQTWKVGNVNCFFKVIETLEDSVAACRKLLSPFIQLLQAERLIQIESSPWLMIKAW